MSSSSKKFLTPAAVIILLGIAGYTGFIYYQGQKVDETIANINKVLGTDEVTVSGEITKKSFFAREVQLMLYLKDISETTKPLAVSEGVVNLGFSPKAVLHLTKVDEFDKDNLVLKSMHPTLAVDFNYRFTPKTATFTTQPFSANIDDVKISVDRTAGKTTFLSKIEGFSSESLSQFQTKFDIGTIKLKQLNTRNSNGGELVIGSQTFQSYSDKNSLTPVKFSYDLEKVDLNQKDLSGDIKFANFSFNTEVSKEKTNFIQNFKVGLDNLNYKSIIPVNIPKADIKLKMDWNASASPYSALFYDQYGDDFCTANPVACQENLPYFGNLGASSEQLLTAITSGKIGLEVLPSYVDAKNIKIAFNGNFRFTKDSNKIGELSFRVSPAEGKSVAPYVGFLPKGTYKMEGKDAVSNILLTHDDDNLLLSINGQNIYSIPMN